jgi:hypothetical protein
MRDNVRNIPCPCGSGQKFKRCCERGFTRADQEFTHSELGRLAEGPWIDEIDRQWDIFRGPGARPPASRREHNQAFIDWLFFDSQAADGTRLLDLLPRSVKLSRGARIYANMMRNTAMRLYEVVGRRGAYFSFQDVLTGTRYLLHGGDLVHLRDHTDLFAARIIPLGESGEPEFHGPIFMFPGPQRSAILGRLRESLVAYRAAHPRAPAIDEFKALGPTVQDLWNRIDDPAPAPLPGPSEDLREAAELRLQQQYDGWIDTPLERLGGESPSVAAASLELRPRVIEILRELEQEYQRCLQLDDPAFDPSLLWDDLGLRETRDGPRDHPPPLGHETIAALVPGLAELAQDSVAGHRRSSAHDFERTIPQVEIESEPEVKSFLRAHTRDRAVQGVDLNLVDHETRELAIHIGLRCNFELHLRKVFWIADGLSWMLGTTSLDGIEGAALRLPFASVALVFTDRYALGLAERLLARVPGCHLRGKILRVITVYISEITLSDGRRGLRVAFTCDANNGDWPVLVGRDFAVDPHARVVDILASEAPGADADELAPLFACIPLRHLLHLVFNTLLRVSRSRRDRAEPRPPPKAIPEAPRQDRRSSEAIFDLPGTIDIPLLRAIQRVRRGAISREQIHRCMVRGYHRRANPDWKDQEERWVKPHWRGPSDAVIVERQYRVLP